MDVLKGVPVWFLIIIIFLMGGAVSFLFGYFLWSIREGVRELKESIEKLFDKHDGHEKRISRLEGKCFNGECGG